MDKRLKCRNGKTINQNAAEQSVHWIGGILRDLQTFFWLRVFSTSQIFVSPARQPVTQTVGPLLAK